MFWKKSEYSSAFLVCWVHVWQLFRSHWQWKVNFLTFFSRFLFSNKKDKNRKKIDVFSSYDSNPHGHKGIDIFNGMSCSEKVWRLLHFSCLLGSCFYSQRYKKRDVFIRNKEFPWYENTNYKCVVQCLNSKNQAYQLFRAQTNIRNDDQTHSLARVLNYEWKLSLIQDKLRHPYILTKLYLWTIYCDIKLNCKYCLLLTELTLLKPCITMEPPKTK